MNPTPDEEDRFSALLRDQTPPLRDDGFANRVLEALPPLRTTRRTVPALIGITVGATAGLGLAFMQRAMAFDGLTITAREVNTLAATLADPWLGLGLTITALSLLFAWWLVRSGERMLTKGMRLAGARRPARWSV